MFFLVIKTIIIFILLAIVSSCLAYAVYLAPHNSTLEACLGVLSLISIIANIVMPIAYWFGCESLVIKK